MNTVISAVIVGLIFGLVGGFFLKQFLGASTTTKKEIIKNYLVYGVALAEQALGSKTGKLKLAKVYNEFIVDMPALATTISYQTFCKLVDQALVIFNEMLKNTTIEQIINGDTML